MRMNRLREYRLKLGLSQSDVAEKLGLADKGGVYRHEAGLRKPDIDTLHKYSKLYKTTVDDLMGEKNTMREPNGFEYTPAPSTALSQQEIVELTKTALLMLAVEDSRALTDDGLVNAFLEKLIHNAAQYKEAGHTPPINAIYAKEVFQQVKDSHAKQGASA